jgi:hypothetical protein
MNGTSTDFASAVSRVLAMLDRLMPQRQRAAALARARRDILAAAAVALAAEPRRVVEMTTSPELREKVRRLVDSHAELLDYLDDLDRHPVIAGELQRLRCSGEIRWVL